MAEHTAAPASQCIVVPDGLDDDMAAAIANPGMSSWAALTERANLKPGETVLINGATGAAGQLAVKIARHLGASRVIATGRNPAKLAASGADVTIALTDDPDDLEQRFKASFADGVDVVVDYLWGIRAERMLTAAAKVGWKGVPVRFVQVGSTSGANISLPSAELRSSTMELKGSGIGSVRLEGLVKAVAGVFGAARSAGLVLPIRPVALAEIEQAWPLNDDLRTVFHV